MEAASGAVVVGAVVGAMAVAAASMAAVGIAEKVVVETAAGMATAVREGASPHSGRTRALGRGGPQRSRGGGL